MPLADFSDRVVEKWKILLSWENYRRTFDFIDGVFNIIIMTIVCH